MILSIVCLLAGFVILIYGADYMIDGSAALARRLNIPVMIIGMTIVAFGTSAPELVVNIFAAVSRSSDIALGNVVGSNILNALGALGLATLVTPLVVNKTNRRIDLPIAIFAALCIVIFATSDLTISKYEGAFLLLCFVFFVTYTFMLAKRSGDDAFGDEVEIHDYSLSKSVILTLFGLGGLIFGGHILVKGAVDIAYEFGISEHIIGLTIVSIGTSLPEIMTSFVAARKGNADIAIGNVVGSNILNTFLILGSSAIITPISARPSTYVDTYLNLFATILILILVYSSKTRRICRLGGAVLIIIYVIYLIYLVNQEIG